MSRWKWVAFLTLGIPSVLSAKEAGQDKLAFFEKNIRPILVDHCYACHSAETKPAGGLRVDDRNGLLAGGNKGAAIVPGNPAESLLIHRVSQKEANGRMPLEGAQLSEKQIEWLTQWIKDGAPWPEPKVPGSLGRSKEWSENLKRDHWAWQPLKKPKAPQVKRTDWVRGEIDRFLLAELEARGIEPVGDATQVQLLRRVTFDLTGLPPTPQELEAFANDQAPEAYTRVVDRLLASPQFAEHWARHWLDVARYGESTGPSRNIPYPFAWRYRDYVIDSFARDLPFHRFIREQVAGDLLPAESEAERDRLNIATGFLAIGVKDVNQRFKTRFVMDNIDEQIDVVTRGFLALTVNCARCHDHKFDPIPATDYYALAGIFASTDNCAGVRNKMGGGGLDYFDPGMLVPLKKGVPPVDASKLEKLREEVAAAKKAWDSIRGTPEGLSKGPDGFPKQRPFRLKYEKLQAELLAVGEPAARGFAIHGVRDSKTVGDTEIRIRGEAEKLGPKVPRGFLTLFEVPGAPSVNRAQSGRKELADWLANPANPLTGRVYVNRVWSHLFGQGLVSTVDNFGSTGAKPTHPELLDHLVQRFLENGWSTKKLVREIVLSHAYQLGAEGSPRGLEIDPASRLVWRHPPRRLTAEEIRDAILATSGSIDPSPRKGSPAMELKMIEMRDNGPEAGTLHGQAEKSVHRSIYLPLLRGVVPSSLEPFDPVDQTLVSGSRESTTVPSQALHLLNSSFVRKQSLVLAQKLLVTSGLSDQQRVEFAFLRILNRKAQTEELEKALQFLATYESDYRNDAWSALDTSSAPSTPSAAKAPKASEIPANPDEIDPTGEPKQEESVKPQTAREASWLALVQTLYASGEFRFVR